MVNNKFGYIISISGSNLKLGEIFEKMVIKPDVVDNKENGVLEIQFCDLQNNFYALDMLSEAIDFIAIHKKDFVKLLSQPGIDEKVIYLYDSTESSGGTFIFDSETIKLLYELGIEVKITVIDDGRRGEGPFRDVGD